MADERVLKLGVDPSDASRGLDRYERGILSSLSSTRQLTGALGILGGAFVALAGTRQIGAVVSASRDFEQAMARVRAISGATEDQFAALSAEARRLGSETRFSATEAAEGMQFLAMAGFSVTETLDAMEDTLELATAGLMGLGQTADIVSNILAGYQMEADQAGRVSDILAQAATSANVTIEGLGSGFADVAPIASDLGIQIEESAAAIALMRDAGIDANRAGTALRIMFTRLLQGGGQVDDALRSMGLTMEDVSPRAHTLAEILRTLEEAGADSEQMIQLVGARGAAVAPLLTRGSEALEEFTRHLEDSEGAAGEMADTMEDTFEGQVRRFEAAMEGLRIEMGQEFLPELTDLLEDLTENLDDITPAARTLAGAVGTLASETDTLVDALQILVGLGVASWATRTAVGLGRTVAQMRAAQNVTVAWGATLRGLLPIMGPQGWLIAGLMTLGTVANRSVRQAQERTEALEEALAESVDEVGELSAAAAEVNVEQFSRGLEDARDEVDRLERELEEAGSAGRGMGASATETSSELREARRTVEQLEDLLAASRDRLREARLEAIGLDEATVAMGGLAAVLGDVPALFREAEEGAEGTQDSLQDSLATLQDEVELMARAVDLGARRFGVTERLVGVQTDVVEQMAAGVDSLEQWLDLMEANATAAEAFRDALGAAVETTPTVVREPETETMGPVEGAIFGPQVTGVTGAPQDAEDAAEALEAVFEESLRGIQRTFADGFRGIGDDWEDVADAMVRTTKDAAAEIAAALTADALGIPDLVEEVREEGLSGLGEAGRGVRALGAGAIGMGVGREAGTAAGMLAGAGAGAAMAGPLGAAVGALGGLASAARDASATQAEYNRALEDFQRIGQDIPQLQRDIEAMVESAASLMVQSIEAIGDVSVDIAGPMPRTVEELERFIEVMRTIARATGNTAEALEEIERIEAMLSDQIREHREQRMEEIEQDLQVRMLRAQGHDEEAEALRRQLQQEQEIQELKEMGAEEELIRLAEQVHAQEELAEATERTIDAMRGATDALNAPMGLRLSLERWRASLLSDDALEREAERARGDGGERTGPGDPGNGGDGDRERRTRDVTLSIGEVTIVQQPGQDGRELYEEFIAEANRRARTGEEPFVLTEGAT